MIRRANIGAFRCASQTASAANKNTIMLAPRATAAARTYVGPLDPFWSCFICFFVTCSGAAWGNSLYSVTKHGLFRHNMNVDNSNIAEGNKTAQTIGAFFGFLLYWFIVGPMKYRHSDMEKWAKKLPGAPF